MILNISYTDDGIRDTNYFELPIAVQGFCLLTINKGNFYLLVPPRVYRMLKDVIPTTHYILITKGIFNEKTCFEILFEDKTQTPFVIHIDKALVIPSPSDEFLDRKSKFSAWIKEDGKLSCVFTRDAFYRKAPRLPYMKPLS